jgi:large subunit ribosomal protein L24
MKFKTGDKVIAIAGKDKGHTGRISKVIKKDNKVVVEGLNIVKKHIKPNANNQNGGIVSVEAPIHASNVMFVDEKANKGSRKRIATVTKEVKKEAPKKAKAKKD